MKTVIWIGLILLVLWYISKSQAQQLAPGVSCTPYHIVTCRVNTNGCEAPTATLQAGFCGAFPSHCNHIIVSGRPSIPTCGGIPPLGLGSMPAFHAPQAIVPPVTRQTVTVNRPAARPPQTIVQQPPKFGQPGYTYYCSFVGKFRTFS